MSEIYLKRVLFFKDKVLELSPLIYSESELASGVVGLFLASPLHSWTFILEQLWQTLMWSSGDALVKLEALRSCFLVPLCLHPLKNICVYTWVICVTQRQAGYHIAQALETSMSACWGAHILYLIYIDWPLVGIRAHTQVKRPCVHKWLWQGVRLTHVGRVNDRSHMYRHAPWEPQTHSHWCGPDMFRQRGVGLDKRT